MTSQLAHRTEHYTTEDGSKLLLLLSGGRVLGLSSSRSEENFYWVNPALSFSDSPDFFRNPGWQNSGGDRTWIAPEVDVFFKVFPDLSSHKVPTELDPGHYEFTDRGQSVQLTNRFTLTLFHSCQSAQVELVKSWNTALNPLRYENAWRQIADVEYAGYTQRTRLRLVDSAADDFGPVGIWNLLQLPHGGDLFIPLYGNSHPKIYFGDIPPGDLEIQTAAIRYKMRSEGIQKIGIRSAYVSGRVGYMHGTADRWALIVRNFFVNPAAEYVDVSWSSSGELGERGDVFQACNVNNELGSFAELEYHAPAIGKGTGRSTHEDVSQVWAFRGSKRSILKVGKNLLSRTF